jgi:hypothetical protein
MMETNELQRHLEAFADRFDERLPAFVDVSARRQLMAEPIAQRRDRELEEAVFRATEIGARRLVAAIRSPSEAITATRRSDAVVARIAARNDISLSSVLNGYRVSHATALDHMLEQAAEDGTQTEVLVTASQRVFRHMDSVVPMGTRAYIDERRRVHSRPDRSRLTAVRAVLAGAEDWEGAGLPGLASGQPSYPLSGHHVAVVLSASQPAAVLNAVAQAIGSAPLLAVQMPDGGVWMWIACSLCEHDVAEALRCTMRGPVHAGVSGHEPGVHGFRAAHRKAQLALRIGIQRGSPVTAFSEVALEALAFGGEQLARQFVAAEMGGLTQDSRRATTLRQTLGSYFSRGSAAAAAQDLGVSERTVTYRLRHVEQMLGRPLTARRAELETALRLHGVFLAAGHAGAAVRRERFDRRFRESATAA